MTTNYYNNLLENTLNKYLKNSQEKIDKSFYNTYINEIVPDIKSIYSAIFYNTSSACDDVKLDCLHSIKNADNKQFLDYITLIEKSNLQLLAGNFENIENKWYNLSLKCGIDKKFLLGVNCKKNVKKQISLSKTKPFTSFYYSRNNRAYLENFIEQNLDLKISPKTEEEVCFNALVSYYGINAFKGILNEWNSLSNEEQQICVGEIVLNQAQSQNNYQFGHPFDLIKLSCTNAIKTLYSDKKISTNSCQNTDYQSL